MACDIDSFSIRRSIEEKSYNSSIFDKENYEDTFSKIYTSRIKTVQLLLAFNADVRMSDKQGQTPLKIARKLPYTDIENLLEENLNKKYNNKVNIL